MKTAIPGDDKKDYGFTAAEMGAEGNYNMIDGIINNTPKSSVLDKIKEYERLVTENPDNAVDRAKMEFSSRSTDR